MQTIISLGLFLPLIGFLILMASSRVICRRSTNIIGCASIFLSFLCFITALITYAGPEKIELFQWIPVKGINAEFALHIDTLSLLMTMIITGVGFLIHVYSTGYMEHEEDYARFFACLNFFVFAMLLLVLAANLLLLFVGWEGVGLASYLLIGYYHYKTSAAQAATKAFVVNRVGDLGFLLGLLLTFILFGTSDIATITSKAVSQYPVGAPVITVLTLLLFIGATGKSAQIPLQTWLPDAMEGPTPVSALIHAATMVTAGVYLVVRLHDLFALSPDILLLIGCVGAITSLYAALSAIGQVDLKRVLAFSTVSQLGLMFLACSVGAYYAAMFHLTTHAFIKALLFLSAGNVVHMMHDETQMINMGGLSKRLPATHILFLIGVIALSGIPPLAAFFSKDLILEQEYIYGLKVLYAIGMVASILTGFYLIRAYCLTFIGNSRVTDKVLEYLHEAPKVMLIPVSVLALLAIIGGFLGFSLNSVPLLESFLDRSDVHDPEISHGFHLSPILWVSIIGAFLGVGAGYYLYSKGKTDTLTEPVPIFRRAFYFDELYWGAIAVPLAALARFISHVLEPSFFDGIIRTVSNGTQQIAGELQKIQSGQIRSYIAWMAIGSILLIAYLTF